MLTASARRTQYKMSGTSTTIDTAIVESWRRLLGEQASHDLIFEAADRHVSAHSVIVCSASHVLRQLVAVSPRAFEGERTRVDVAHLASGVIDILLNCIYCGSVQLSRLRASPPVAAGLCVGALDLVQSWQIDYIKPILERALITHVASHPNIETLLSTEALSILSEARKHASWRNLAVHYTQGQRLEAQWQAQTKPWATGYLDWYPGHVVVAHEDGSCDVQFDDGGFEARIPLIYLRRAAFHATPPAAPAPSPSSSWQAGKSPAGRSPRPPKRPSELLADTPQQLPATATSTAPSPAKRSSKDISAAPAAKKASASQAAPIPAAKPRTGPGKMTLAREPMGYAAAAFSYDVEMRVECRFAGAATWYPGKISKADRVTNTYTIAYDDGDVETGVAANLIRISDGQEPVRRDAKEVKKTAKIVAEADISDLHVGQVILAYGASPTGEWKYFRARVR